MEWPDVQSCALSLCRLHVGWDWGPGPSMGQGGLRSPVIQGSQCMGEPWCVGTALST